VRKVGRKNQNPVGAVSLCGADQVARDRHGEPHAHQHRLAAPDLFDHSPPDRFVLFRRERINFAVARQRNDYLAVFGQKGRVLPQRLKVNAEVFAERRHAKTHNAL